MVMYPKRREVIPFEAKRKDGDVKKLIGMRGELNDRFQVGKEGWPPEKKYLRMCCLMGSAEVLGSVNLCGHLCYRNTRYNLLEPKLIVAEICNPCINQGQFTYKKNTSEQTTIMQWHFVYFFKEIFEISNEFV
ncbi:uncharacterized protein LOC111241692 isoform X2 [Vigna radiata var. radiata]|uniref:Uncharacterized protein LOC111241692 isoform X2 n=1 Tax=Vigna radiata var. radiata TaxID=3916 RepID=A0A3Q0EYW9_VIGRR|nr:uncharacterized protein LOC111241692 isoform X2 [Vigna radiata var. radiata]